jgi:hypothetical protein
MTPEQIKAKVAEYEQRINKMKKDAMADGHVSFLESAELLYVELQLEGFKKIFALRGASDEITQVAPVMGSEFHIVQPTPTSCYYTSVGMIDKFMKAKGIGMKVVPGWDKSIQIATQIDKVGNNYKPKDPDKAFKYINACLKKGVPVLVGVSHANFNGDYNSDKTTDHFIVVVGSTTAGEVGYHYMDPGSKYGGQVHNNVLVQSKEPGKEYIWNDAASPIGTSYILVSVFEYDKPIEGMEQHSNTAEQHNNKNTTQQQTTLKANSSLSASVGVNGPNRPADVLLVQKALNKVKKAGLVEDAVCGPLTIEAIIKFQQQNFGWADGSIDVGGQTEGKLFTDGVGPNILEQVYEHGKNIVNDVVQQGSQVISNVVNLFSNSDDNNNETNKQLHDGVSEPAWMKVARKEMAKGFVEGNLTVGEHEHIKKYFLAAHEGAFEQYKDANISSSAHWCAAFVTFCMKESGNPTFGWAGLNVNAWKAWASNNPSNKPFKGAIAIYQSNHIGFCTDVKNGVVVLLGGNQGSGAAGKISEINFASVSQFTFVAPPGYQIPSNAYF